jgi:hypothetical protein
MTHIMKTPDGRSFDRDRVPKVKASNCMVHFIPETMELLFVRDDGKTIEAVAFVEIEKQGLQPFLAAMLDAARRAGMLPPSPGQTPRRAR